LDAFFTGGNGYFYGIDDCSKNHIKPHAQATASAFDTRMLLAPPCPIRVWISNHFSKWTKKYLGAKGVVLPTLVSDLQLALEVVKQF
jgi:hypothetical protein